MFITKFINLQNQIRIFHWQTKSYSEHKALGSLYEGLDPLIDEFVEVYFGKNGIRKHPRLSMSRWRIMEMQLLLPLLMMPLVS